MGTHFAFSQIYATNGQQQVGEGNARVGGITIGYHAIAWSGNPDDFVDLQAFLPPQFGTSTAFGIDADGIISGTATYAGQGSTHAVIWIPIPEPGTAISFYASVLVLGSRRRSRTA
jgi:hypothetical protein